MSKEEFRKKSLEKTHFSLFEKWVFIISGAYGTLWIKDDWLNRVKENIGKQNVKSNIPHLGRTF